MKIAYYSVINFADVDLSYLQEMQQLQDIVWIVQIGPKFKGTAINIDCLYPKSGVFKAMDIYPDIFGKFAKFVNLDKVFVVNNCGKHGYSLKTLWCQILFLCFLLKNRFDLIHITQVPYYFERWLFLFGKKTLLTVHDPIPHSTYDTLEYRPFERRRKIAFKFYKYFVILNKAQREAFINRYHLGKKKIFESRLGRYDYLKIYNNTVNNPITHRYILFFGAISSYKGLDYLLPAMEKVHKVLPHLHLIIAGKGDFGFDIKHYQTLEYIHILNRFIPDDELATLIKHTEFIVCPYKDATQSGVVMSAYVFNKPVIATNVGGLPEMVINDKFGKIIPPCDEEVLISTIIDLASNSNLLETYSQNIEQKYSHGELSWKGIASEMNQIYNQIVKSK